MTTPPTKSLVFDLLLVSLFSLPVISPLWQATIPQSADGLLHLYRVIALDAAWQQGGWLPRWLPDLAYGYGMPLFVYYAPLSYILTEILHVIGLNFITAFNFSFMLAIWLGGVGMYLFSRHQHGNLAGIMASVAYMYAPYNLLTAFFRGSLPIVWAWAMIPWAFWAFSRLMRRGQWADVPLAALCCGAALLMHNISNLLFFPVLLLYILLGSFNQRANWTWRQHLYPVMALVWGLSLAAFFLLPAILEQSFIQVQRVITPPDFDYHANFLTLYDLFSPPQPTNVGLLNPNSPPQLGWSQLILAILGVITLFKKPLFTPYSLLLISIFMTLPVSVQVWDSIPMLAFMQQPQRFLSLAAFLLAILVGQFYAKPIRFYMESKSLDLTVKSKDLDSTFIIIKSYNHWTAIIGLTFIYLAAIPLLYPRYYEPLPAELTITDMWQYEQKIGAIGTTSFGEYLPKAVQQIPHELPANVDAGRLDLAYLPPQSEAKLISTEFNALEWHINSPKPYQAVWHIFYFPGWQATIDGQPVPLTPFSERGLISLPMPTGEHHIQLYFTETPLRQAANVISIITWILVISYWSFVIGHWLTLLQKDYFGVQRFSFALQKTSKAKALHPSLQKRHWLFTSSHFLFLIPLIFLLTKLFYFDIYDNPFKHQFRNHQVTEAATKLQVNFGNQLNLLGYNLNSTTVMAGESFKLTAYWQAQQPLPTDYSILLHLVDSEHNLYAGQDNLHPGNFPTTRWDMNGFVQDQHTLHVPSGTPPGDYFLAIGPYQPMTWQRLAVLAGGDKAWGDVFPIRMRIMKPPQPPTLAELGIAWPQAQALTPAIRLLGATPERAMIRRNDFLRLALFWEATEQPEHDYQVSLRLLNQTGHVILTQTNRPSYHHYSTLQWVKGERVRDNQAMWIPADWLAGTYQLQLQLVSADGQAVNEWLTLGELGAE